MLDCLVHWSLWPVGQWTNTVGRNRAKHISKSLPVQFRALWEGLFGLGRVAVSEGINHMFCYFLVWIAWNVLTIYIFFISWTHTKSYWAWVSTQSWTGKWSLVETSIQSSRSYPPSHQLPIHCQACAAPQIRPLLGCCLPPLPLHCHSSHLWSAVIYKKRDIQQIKADVRGRVEKRGKWRQRKWAANTMSCWWSQEPKAKRTKQPPESRFGTWAAVDNEPKLNAFFSGNSQTLNLFAFCWLPSAS